MEIKKITWNNFDDFVELLEENDEISLDFENFVVECEENVMRVDWFDRLSKNSVLCDYQWGYHAEENFFNVGDYIGFLDNAENFAGNFGGEELQRSITTAQKLLQKGSNLFGYYVQGIADRICKDFFVSAIDTLKEAFLYGEKSTNFQYFCEVYGEDFLDCRNYYMDKDKNLVRLVNLTA